ncbi:hypothetical protein [Leptolyngbya sp. NIES-2104]|uniref:hypothetical protein n=1 Tax=Leptolyngbya sp. NIES-2104 TaxID=1552121 RepID=UPI0006ECA435|nr:hypothetical protein [Leptolyngbya sp. NIES-2104]GAP99810.1 hypothetical protein NIES2104_63760 [Leptolyngbya sp. NIES-2104]
MPTLNRLPQSTQSLLQALKAAEPNQPISLSRFGKVAPAEVEAAFDNLNQAFSFDPATGQVARSAGVELSSDEEQVVQQLLGGYQRQLQAGAIKLRRGTNQRFVPLPDEPEEEHQGVVTKAPADASLLAPETDAERTMSSDLNSLVAQGCGWQWWRKKYWWGVRISFNRTAVNWLASAGGAAAGILASMGIGGIAATVIALIVGALKAIANDNGIRIYITWAGIWWATPKPTPSGGC